MDRLIDIDLTKDERYLLVQGVLEYGAMIKMSLPLIPPLIGVASVDDLLGIPSRLVQAIDLKDPLSHLDWTRALLLTEISWGSEILGCGMDFGPWARDEVAAPWLRSIQCKIDVDEGYDRLLDVARPFLTKPRADNIHNGDHGPATRNGDLLSVDLTEDERLLMLHALHQYLGPARKGAPFLAPLMGVDSTPEFEALVRRFFRTIEAQLPMFILDWVRALVLTEMSWASAVLGYGPSFESIAPDETTTPLMRSIQNELYGYDNYKLLENNSRVIAPRK